MAKLIIFHSHLCELGGCETVLYNLCQQLRNWYDITVLHQGGSQKQIDRLNELVDLEVYDKNKTYNCDIMIRNSAWGIFPEQIISKTKYIQIIHADYELLKERGQFNYIKWGKTTEHIACGEFVAKQFTKVTGYECGTIKNILADKITTNKIYHFIYAGRLSEDKGGGRILTFIKMLKLAKIKFTLDIFSDGKLNTDFEEVRIMNPRYYDIQDYLADADYSILFSDAERTTLRSTRKSAIWYSLYSNCLRRLYGANTT